MLSIQVIKGQRQISSDDFVPVTKATSPLDLE